MGCEMSKLIDHAKEELRRAGLLVGQDSYEGAIADAVLRLVEAHAKELHNGDSSARVVSIFQKLANFEPLTPLTGDPSEWEKIPAQKMPEMIQVELWQNKRQRTLFSQDGGKTHFTIENYSAYLDMKIISFFER